MIKKLAGKKATSPGWGLVEMDWGEVDRPRVNPDFICPGWQLAVKGLRALG
jgi:hypothetical protein